MHHGLILPLLFSGFLCDIGNHITRPNILIGALGINIDHRFWMCPLWLYISAFHRRISYRLSTETDDLNGGNNLHEHPVEQLLQKHTTLNRIVLAEPDNTSKVRTPLKFRTPEVWSRIFKLDTWDWEYFHKIATWIVSFIRKPNYPWPRTWPIISKIGILISRSPPSPFPWISYILCFSSFSFLLTFTLAFLFTCFVSFSFLLAYFFSCFLVYMLLFIFLSFFLAFFLSFLFALIRGVI